MKYVKLEGNLQDKIKIEKLEVDTENLEISNAELATTVDSILTEVIPSLMGV